MTRLLLTLTAALTPFSIFLHSSNAAAPSSKDATSQLIEARPAKAGGDPADTTAPTIVSVTPAPGSVLSSLTQITVRFSEPITGLSTDDLNVHGIGANGLTGSNDTYTFTFAPAPDGFVPITWVSGHSIRDLAVPPNLFDEAQPGATWSYTIVDSVPPTVATLFPAAGATVQTLGQIQINFSEDVVGVNAADLLINNQPATNVLAQPNAVYVFQFPPPPNGSVSVAFASGHGITDLAAASNIFAGGSWSYTVNPSSGFVGVIINEFNAANENGLKDEDGEEQDWIELYNAGTNAVNLAGWSLSDTEDEPGQWAFPSRLLTPGQYLVVFASAKDRKNPTGTNRFHTNFKLAADPEFLGLFTPDSPRQLASGFAPKYPLQRNNYSYGRDSSGQLRYFVAPTPGASNGTSTITGVVEPVHFSTTRGHFSQPFTLLLSCPTRGSTIRYTTNGTEPTAVNGLNYSLPLTVNGTLLLRAVAFRTNLLPSPVASHSFLFNQTAAIRSLPIISIQTASNNLTGPTGIIGMNGGNYNSGTWAPNPGATNDYYNPTKTGIAWERPMSVEFIRPLDNSGFQIDCGMRVQGSDYTRPRYTPTSKFSYRLYFRGDYSSSRLEYPIFSDSVVQNFDQIVMRAGHNDESNPFLRDELVRQLAADTGQVASHGAFVNFFINGVYKGYYNPCERIEEGFLQSWHGGGSSWDILTVGSAVQGGDGVEWNNMLNYVRNQNVLLPSVYTEIARRLDVVNFIDYLLVNVYGASWDWPHNNWRAARERAPGGIFRFYIWDAEGAFGLTGRGTTFDSFTTTDSPLLNGSAEIPTLYTRLRASPEFRLLWADRVQKHFFNNGALTDTNIASRFIQMRAELLGVIPSIDNSILNTWIPQRRAPLMAQFANYGLRATTNAPFFNQHGGTVAPGFNLTMSITNGSGTIYYTTNGDDPRVMFSGMVSNSAAAYSSPLTLNQSTLVKARTLNGTNWSALTEASFAVATLGVPLRITEINYNPVDSTAYEFIELQNIGTTPVDLSGMNFEGVTYTFPNPSTLAGGARLVLASDFDPAAFGLRYPGVTVRGYYSGSLNNGGDRIVLKDAAGNIITSVDYDDESGWPVAADRGGSSLEIVNVYGDPDDPANWRASATPGGTPGTAPAPQTPGSVQLSEVLADNVSAVNHAGTFPDFVELANTSGSAVNLTGWSITDDGNARKFIFPPGTMIDGNGYLTVWCDAITNTTPGLHGGFSFGRNGDNVFLYDANTNLADALTFGLQLPNYSVGRVGGNWALATPTTNAANTAAAIGSASSLSINEFLANALPGSPDWIELFNNSALPVPLRGTFLSITTAVHQITSLSFIAPFGFAQLFADEGVGPDHLDFKLPAAGGAIVLYDTTAAEVNRVSYTAQSEGVSRGRLPDGAATLANFPGTASPGATNYTASYAGPVLNEVLARNVSAVTNAAGRVADYIELYNPNANAFSLAGFRLSVNSPESGQWIFPPGASVAGQGYVVIWCDGGQPASFSAGNYNTGSALNGESGGAYLFNAAGQLVNSIEYGFQVPDRSIGLSGGAWRLLAAPTPGAVNSAASTLGSSTALRLNEWMAQAANGPDWFEIFNSTNLPVDMTRLVLTDDPTTSGTNEFRVPPLSFIDAGGFVQWIADSQTDQGRNHVNFDLDALGETIRLYATNGSTVIASVTFGVQNLGVSQGSIPDGAANIASFSGSATPGESNYRLINDIVINEVLTYLPGGLDAVELRNNAADTPLGGWFLSNDGAALRKYRIPDWLTIQGPGGFMVFNESQFNTGPNGFTLDRAHGGEVWLSAADGAGNLTGYRTRAKFGASAPGVSFGRYEGPDGIDFVAEKGRTLGGDNFGPQVGPVMIHEIMYHPLENVAGATEFIELRNIAASAIDLFDSFYQPSNCWRLSGGIEFSFPTGTRFAAGGALLVVGFDPIANPATLAAFRSYYGVPPSVPIFGPYSGKLDNAEDTIELLKPDLPDGAFVPYVLVDKVHYRDSAPWPAGAVDGGGFSLHRRTATAYGNHPGSWFAGLPTAGNLGIPTALPPPAIVQSPTGTNALVNTDVFLQASATGIGPFAWQWRFNGAALPGETNALLSLSYVRLNDAGTYDVYVSNSGGSAFSAAAQVTVVEPAVILSAPPSQVALRGGLNTTFNVVANGTEPLRYQWRFDGVDIPGATTPTLVLTNLSLPLSGIYSMVVSNAYGTAVSNVALIVLVNPGITNQPTPQTVVQHKTARFTVVAGPNHPLLPLNYRWLRNGVNFLSNAPATLIITNVQPSQAGSFRVTVTNLAGNVNSSTVALTVLPDADADGLPDAWETNYFGNPTNAMASADSDGDGMSNLDEFIAGTNPTDALSVLKIALTATNAGLLEFVAQTDIAYVVQFRTNLEATSWSSLTNIGAQSLVRTVQVSVPNPPPEPRRFYRIVTPPVP